MPHLPLLKYRPSSALPPRDTLLPLAALAEARGVSGDLPPPRPGNDDGTMTGTRHATCRTYTRDAHTTRAPLRSTGDSGPDIRHHGALSPGRLRRASQLRRSASLASSPHPSWSASLPARSFSRALTHHRRAVSRRVSALLVNPCQCGGPCGSFTSQISECHDWLAGIGMPGTMRCDMKIKIDVLVRGYMTDRA